LEVQIQIVAKRPLERARLGVAMKLGQDLRAALSRATARRSRPRQRATKSKGATWVRRQFSDFSAERYSADARTSFTKDGAMNRRRVRMSSGVNGGRVVPRACWTSVSATATGSTNHC